MMISGKFRSQPIFWKKELQILHWNLCKGYRRSRLYIRAYRKYNCKTAISAFGSNKSERAYASDGTFEMLPQYECNDMNECAFEKLKTEEEDCIVPEVRWCSRRKWFDNCGRKQFIDVAEGKLSLDEFMAQLSDKELLHLLADSQIQVLQIHSD